jgi:CsoR family transcriptional regulator, copper-sensing transcriptional repressor
MAITPQELNAEKMEAHAAHHHVGRLCMPETARKVVMRRLAIARGHLESILHALEKQDTYCVDVLRQIKAVQGALEKAGQITLESHLRVHVATAAERGDTETIVEELMDALRYR